ncbi:Similar to hypothetical protein [Tuber melanosporum Mel28]; acc. no. XP_002839579 [Pyronema omphalodes CBS 100304]|nr:Similar to hypothetical protein [Tuber melanosporum Mel28]; acc. no. XP_002839579 [Pyronema omphalodes CBS 100304]
MGDAALLNETDYTFSISAYNSAIAELDKVLKKVSVGDVLTAAKYKPLDYSQWMRDTPYFIKGFRWSQKDPADETDTEWSPQGLTTSWDSGYPSGSVDGQDNILLVSWNDQRNKTGASSEAGKGVRVSFLRNATAQGVSPVNRAYTHALLVEPFMNGQNADYRLLDNVISGGIVWRGDYLYITDRQLGLRVFDLKHIYQVKNDASVGKNGNTYSGGGYDYVIPQAYTYTKSLPRGVSFSPHSASLDRNTTPPCLLLGESTPDGTNATFARFFLNSTSNLLSISKSSSPTKPVATWAYKALLFNSEGATFANGNYWLTSNDGDNVKGELYQWLPGERTDGQAIFPPGVQGIAYKPAGDELWVVGSVPGKRYVMALNAGLKNATLEQVPAAPTGGANDGSGGSGGQDPAVQSKKKMSGGAIAGTVIGVLIGVSLVGGGVFMIMRRRKAAQTPPVQEPVYLKPELSGGAGVAGAGQAWGSKKELANEQHVVPAQELPQDVESHMVRLGENNYSGEVLRLVTLSIREMIDRLYD